MRISRRDVLLGSAAAIPSLAALSLLGGRARAAPHWTLPEQKPFKVIENTWITLKDGTRLASKLWIPEAAASTPVPVVWEYLPYRLRDVKRERDEATAVSLAPYGIAFARVDIRGTGDSEGVQVDEYDVPELNDGVEVIDWLAKQPWSNGSVGMRGLSWGGINSLQIAAMAPPALKAIMPMGCCDNRYTDDAHYQGGALTMGNVGWGGHFKTVMAGPPDPEIVGPQWEKMWRQRLAATPSIIETWTRHQRYDAYWQRGSVEMDYGAIKCPVYVVDGWGDPYSNIIGRLLANLKVPRKGLIGPWGHVFPNLATPLGLEWAHEEVRWWQQWLGGVDTGIMDEPMLRVYMMYKADSEAFPAEVPGRWVAEQAWPSSRIQSSVMYFDTGNRMSPQVGSHEHVKYVADEIVGLTKPQWVYGRPTEFEQTPDDSKSLVFDSAPLDGDMEILGYPVARIRVSADVAVAKLAVRLTEVTPDGKSWLVTYNLLNLTHRNGHEHPVALKPGESYDVEVPLYMIAHRFRKGNRVRVAISENLWPLVWPSPKTATLNIALGVSSLTLPVRPTTAVEAPFTIPMIHASSSPNQLTQVQTGPDANGKIILGGEVGPAQAQPPLKEIGTILANGGGNHFEITAGDPNTCLWRRQEITGWKRGDWDCTVITGFELTSTPEEFHLKEYVLAKKGDKQIFEREKKSNIKRDLL
jgi:putative CocE/NonD family hydrolase